MAVETIVHLAIDEVKQAQRLVKHYISSSISYQRIFQENTNPRSPQLAQNLAPANASNTRKRDQSQKLDAVRLSLRNHVYKLEAPEHVKPKQDCTNSKRAPGSPLASKTNTKRQKADYPAPVPRILLSHSSPKCSFSEQKVQDNKQSVSGKKVNSPEEPAKSALLLDLPAEIRWQIYQYLFEPHRVEILRRKDMNTDTSKPARYRLCHRQQKPRSPSTQAVDHDGHRTRHTPFLFGLVFTCRTIYCEAVLLLYSTAQFIFNSANSIIRFLRTTSKDFQAAIRHVELNHIMYNEPRLTEFRPFKIRSDIAWYNACEEMASACVSLKVLHVRLAIYDWPIRLEIGELWSMPLLLFGHYDGGLDYAGIQLQMRRFQDDKLRTVERALEQTMMKPKMFQIREDERLSKELMGPIKAKKVLKIVV
ncbi:unnamed protein product [Aspergillus oryzae]|uniref:Unnamed protein product n=2 Tax=Aspergillus oryzae TaxID=5062 RepID=A0AAN4YPD2_ASPOZ|nr:unnamed protein product [Aspergillus oryzae]GMF86885.1 unnamed protein product [Aspergillus oryzae]GMG12793.1 unnamed protein product [Aspergillus oryzae]GMG31259.1 unnamed protein product [Aspergillus oryzae]GMG52973.1 unnamed protein product [Aspergillus oryzae var. brunneus]